MAGDVLSWQQRAACRSWDPEVFFAEKDRGLALHVCRQHCEVVRKCLLWSRRVKTTYSVQGGVVWTETGAASKLGHTPDRRCVRCRL